MLMTWKAQGGKDQFSCVIAKVDAIPTPVPQPCTSLFSNKLRPVENHQL